MLDYLRHLFVPHHSNNQRAKLLHPSGVVVVMLLWLVFQFGLEGAVRIRPDILGYAAQIAAEEVVRLTNEKRQSQGLGALRIDPLLSKAAAQKASDMLARDYWAHVSPVGTQPWFFITEAGYGYRYAGENLARDFTNPAAIIEAWMASPTHRDNLLNAKYQDIGIAVVDGRLGGQETTLVVQMFGTKLSAVAPKPEVGSASIVKPVSAATQEVVSEPAVEVPKAKEEVTTNKVNPFFLTKAVGVGLVGLFVLILAIDVALVNRLKIMRWTSKSFAHFCFMLFLFTASLIIGIGKIV